MGVTLNIPDSVVQCLRIPKEEIVQRLQIELAVALYSQGMLSLGKAAVLAEMNRMLFGELVGAAGNRPALRRHGVGPRRLLWSWRVIRRQFPTSPSSPA